MLSEYMYTHLCVYVSVCVCMYVCAHTHIYKFWVVCFSELIL